MWDGPDKNTDFTEGGLRGVRRRGRAGRPEAPVPRLRAACTCSRPSDSIFYQIPDRILADFGLGHQTSPSTRRTLDASNSLSSSSRPPTTMVERFARVPERSGPEWPSRASTRVGSVLPSALIDHRVRQDGDPRRRRRKSIGTSAAGPADRALAVQGQGRGRADASPTCRQGGKYHHLLGDADVEPLAEYDADDVADSTQADRLLRDRRHLQPEGQGERQPSSSTDATSTPPSSRPGTRSRCADDAGQSAGR